MGKQKEKGSDEDKKERGVPIFKPNGPVKVLQRQRVTRHTGYERPPQHLMGAKGGQIPQPTMVVTDQRNESWGSQGKMYPLKGRPKNQWGGYGKQYGAGSERRGYQTYKTDRTQPQDRNTAYGSQRQSSYVPTRSTGGGQGGNGGNGEENNKRKYRNTRISQESDSHEESDTEDFYEFEITSQQLSQVTPGGGALKIKLSKKKPLKITAGAPDGQSQTIPMELEHIPSFRRSDRRSQIDTTSESTLPTRGLGAPLFISPIHPENSVRPQKGTSAQKGNDLKGSTNYGLSKERVAQVQSSGTRGSQGPERIKNLPGNGVEEILLEELVGIRDFQVKVEVLPEEVIIRQQEEEMMILTLVMTGVEMTLPPQTPLPKEKENIKVLSMSMYSKDLLDQKVKRVNLDKQEEMVETDKILP